VRIEVCLFRDEAETPLKIRKVLIYAAAVVEDLTVGRFHKPGEHADGRTFSGPVVSQIAKDFPRLDNEADLMDCPDMAVILREQPGFQHLRDSSRLMDTGNLPVEP
jgi:hypothetical protein